MTIATKQIVNHRALLITGFVIVGFAAAFIAVDRYSASKVKSKVDTSQIPEKVWRDAGKSFADFYIERQIVKDFKPLPLESFSSVN